VYLLTRKVNEARCENRDVEYRTEQNNIHRYTDAAAPIHMQSNAKWQTFRRANKRTLSPMHTHTHTQDSAFVFGLAFAFGSLNEKLNVDVYSGWCGRFGRRSLKGQFKEANEKHSARSVRAAVGVVVATVVGRLFIAQPCCRCCCYPADAVYLYRIYRFILTSLYVLRLP